MRAPLFMLGRGELLGILFTVVILVLLAFVSLEYPDATAEHMMGGGWGPD